MGSSKICTFFKRKPNHFNIYPHTIGVSVKDQFHKTALIAGEIATGNVAPLFWMENTNLTQNLCEKSVPTKCLTTSVVPSGQKFQLSSEIRVLRNKIILIWSSSLLSAASIRQRYLNHFPSCSLYSSSTSTVLPQAKTAESLRDQWTSVFSHIPAISPALYAL